MSEYLQEPGRPGGKLAAVAKAFDGLLAGAAWISAVLWIGLAFLITASVVLRYAFRMPLGWSTEVSEYATFLGTLFGAAWVLRRDGHVSLDFAVTKLPRVPRAVAGALANLCGVLICLLITYQGALSTLDAYRRGIRVIKVMALDKYLLLMFIPMAGALLSVVFLQRLAASLRSIRDRSEPEFEAER